MALTEVLTCEERITRMKTHIRNMRTIRAMLSELDGTKNRFEVIGIPTNDINNFLTDSIGSIGNLYNEVFVATSDSSMENMDWRYAEKLDQKPLQEIGLSAIAIANISSIKTLLTDAGGTGQFSVFRNLDLIQLTKCEDVENRLTVAIEATGKVDNNNIVVSPQLTANTADTTMQMLLKQRDE